MSTAALRSVGSSQPWKPPLSESSKASEIESKETFRTSLSQRGAKVSLDLLKGYSWGGRANRLLRLQVRTLLSKPPTQRVSILPTILSILVLAISRFGRP